MTSGRFEWVRDDIVLRQLADVDALVREVVYSEPRLREVYAQLTSPKAKRLRPALLLLAARFGRARADASLVRAAATIELVHEATLLHDDIVDRGLSRRGLPSAHAELGPRAAAVAGSALLFRAAVLSADLPSSVRGLIGRTGERLCGGQSAEIFATGANALSSLSRLRVTFDKTAALFHLAASVGVRLGRVEATASRRLERFALRFGCCWQLADDLRDILVPESVLGRAPGADLREGIATLPIMLALEHAPADVPGPIRACFGARDAATDDRVACALRALRSSGAARLGIDVLERWVIGTVACLDGAALAEPADARESLVRLMSELAAELARMRMHAVGRDEPHVEQTGA